jgi:DNA repair protein RecN (Recombination protein N)
MSLEPGEPLLITRKLYASGRSGVSLNGQPATAPMVRAIGELLVDVHGQHDHQYLLKPSNQLLVLDGFARAMDLRDRFASLHGQISALRKRLAELNASQTLRRQQLDLYEFQAQEIDAAAPQAGEFPQLKARQAMLRNVQKLRRDAGAAHAALYDSEGAIVERLQMLTHLLGDLCELDDSLRDTTEQVRTATLTLQEAAFELARYVDRLETDPRELSEVEDRLNTLNRLIAKHGASKRPLRSRAEADLLDAANDPVAGVVAYRAQIEEQIRQLRAEHADASGLAARIAELSRELKAVGMELHERRAAAAKRLQPLVVAELRELGMADAEFEVAFDSVDGAMWDPQAGGAGDSLARDAADDDAAAFPTESHAESASLSATGFDRIEMLVRANPGQPARPLRKVASGGELSRIMLALKSTLAHSDRISVLVFDEIDANIGGRMGTVIGRKMRELAGKSAGGFQVPVPPGASARKGKRRDAAAGAGPVHQILCITHLPQIAAFAHRHMRIAKSVTGKGDARQTVTSVTRLEGKERIEELAEMLAGKDVTATTRKQVEEMMAAAG